MEIYNLSKLYTEYDKCHTNIINKIMNILTNFIIVICIMILGFYINLFGNNLTNIFMITYIAYYLIIRIKLGIIMLFNLIILKEISFSLFYIFPDIWIIIIFILSICIILQYLIFLKNKKYKIKSLFLVMPVYHILVINNLLDSE